MLLDTSTSRFDILGAFHSFARREFECRFPDDLHVLPTDYELLF